MTLNPQRRLIDAGLHLNPEYVQCVQIPHSGILNINSNSTLGSIYRFISSLLCADVKSFFFLLLHQLDRYRVKRETSSTALLKHQR